MLRYRYDGGEIITPAVTKYPDGTFKIDLTLPGNTPEHIGFIWTYGDETEQMQLYYMVSSLKESFPCAQFGLFMPYLPNARMDRVHEASEVFTLKYFCRFINSMGFDKVQVIDAHSNVGAALLDRVENISPKAYIEKAMERAGFDAEKDQLFFPDEGSMKRYGGMFKAAHLSFGMKKRDWATGKILGLDVSGDDPKGRRIFIIDDICAYGGTVFYSAQKLKELGCGEINVFFTHCENSISEGKLFECGMINKIYTTNSLCTLDTEKYPMLDIIDCIV